MLYLTSAANLRKQMVLHKTNAADDLIKCPAKKYVGGWKLIEVDEVKYPYQLCVGCFRELNLIGGRPQGNTNKGNTTRRICLKCKGEFASRSKFNRLCNDCNEENLVYANSHTVVF